MGEHEGLDSLRNRCFFPQVSEGKSGEPITLFLRTLPPVVTQSFFDKMAPSREALIGRANTAQSIRDELLRANRKVPGRKIHRGNAIALQFPVVIRQLLKGKANLHQL